ncbi:nucleoside hydrolase [Kibdelosporangium phytohabitans]|uniref:Nucleoside hydrolase n=1 Tax=Kibdelosporangium phytohabitans TaxID=860235 RepID=A0A0N9HSK5_9PSEU|nr:nucleoside hydrolase [Kibdelosporangium phytohabitans]ALG05805.1 nucleoside hydrolase [Kibdelosporangium phytohabitans]MBE1466179.1 pyrimidine-specific ribonucleoside hydrolase [Kibdelosporangium phytohabitans]
MRRLIIDTDPGVDDAFAIALAARHPDVDLLALTTVAGNIGIEHTTRNALNLLALCGREDVPVAVGAHRPFSRAVRGDDAHGNDGLGGHAHNFGTSSANLDPRDAVTLLVDLLTAAEEPVTIVPIGPLTNIALLLAAHPGIKPKIERLVVMGGGINGGNITPSAEFNFWVDPEAARRVLVEEDVPVTLVPLDITMRVAVGDDWLAELAAANDVGRELTAMTPGYRAFYKKDTGKDDLIVHDAIAVAEAIRPGILRTTPMMLDVDCTDGPGSGATIADVRNKVDPPNGRVVDVALDADIEGLRSYILDELSSRY